MEQTPTFVAWNLTVNTKHVALVSVHRLPCLACKQNSDDHCSRIKEVVACILPPPEHHGEMCSIHLTALNSTPWIREEIGLVESSGLDNWVECVFIINSIPLLEPFATNMDLYLSMVPLNFLLILYTHLQSITFAPDFVGI
jgi:hypothetical protein